MIGPIGAAVVIAGVAVAVGVGVGMAVAASHAAEATKYAADRAAEAQKYSSEQQRMASDHEADLLFKTEQADRAMDEKYRKEDMESEKQMMAMFDMIDEDSSSAELQTQRRGERVPYSEITGDDYSYPEPSDADMSFS